MDRTLILYESKYGYTEKIVKKLALILGPAKSCRVTEFIGNSSDYEMVVICTPVYFEFIDGKVLEFVSSNIGWLKEKKIILLCTCPLENMINRYLEPLFKILGDSIVSSAAIKNDHDDIKFIKLALDIKCLKEEGKNIVEEQTLREQIDEFIERHNTCTLATGHDGHIRATPIEYIYKNRALYILSEGGEKFANILINPNVSLCIYDPYKSMNELAGMQITGLSEIINIGCDEYVSALEKKGINLEKILSLPVTLNMIKISIQKIEFLCSEFSRQGYDTKQILYQTLSAN